METVYLNRERARREMKYRQFISVLVGKQKTPFDMTKICKLDGEMECDPTKVHDILTEWFSRWFAADRPVSETLHEDQRWADFLNDRTAFDNLLSTTSLPSWTKDLLWSTMQSTALRLTQADRDDLSQRLRRPPSYEDFVNRLIKPRGGPTAGQTGLTYNMMSQWPEEVMKLVYESLCKLMAEEHTPSHWKNKLLIPMPKVPDPRLDQLRPLMLIEVLRKVWSGFNVNEVWRFLEKHQLLEDIQFAYRRNREAGVAMLLQRNAVEEAQETESAILLGSYDKYHAFDALTRAAMKLSFCVGFRQSGR
jgi:hypothetical protein